MVRKLRIKLFKKSNVCVYITVGYNKKAKPSKFLAKLGVIMITKDSKYVFLSLKKIGYWLNRGASLNSYVSFLIGMLLYKKKILLNVTSITKR